MIKEEMKQFIEGAQGMSAGTRDTKMIPEYCRVLGAWVTDDRTVKMHIASETSDRTLSNIDDNGMIAISMASPINFECYQLKGKVLNYQDPTEEDKKRLDHYMKNWDLAVQNIGAGPGIVFNWPHSPSIVVEMQVEQIFDQTPKIGAGNPLNQST